MDSLWKTILVGTNIRHITNTVSGIPAMRIPGDLTSTNNIQIPSLRGSEPIIIFAISWNNLAFVPFITIILLH